MGLHTGVVPGNKAIPGDRIVIVDGGDFVEGSPEYVPKQHLRRPGARV